MLPKVLYVVRPAGGAEAGVLKLVTFKYCK
jgi:hypothetical protein